MSVQPARATKPLVGGAWAERLVELARAWKVDHAPEHRDAVLDELWPLLNLALGRCLRAQLPRYGSLSREDLEDIAAEKSLGLIRKLDRGAWDPSAFAPAQIHAFVTTIARNGLVDHVRSMERRQLQPLDGPSPWDESARERAAARGDAADSRVNRLRYATALCECVRFLTPRTRRAWFLRVFYDMPSKSIAAYPGVGMSAPAVDVALARTRDRIASCMQAKGYGPCDMPPGTLAVLWEAFEYRRGPGMGGSALGAARQ